jgi:hypothetical protein
VYAILGVPRGQALHWLQGSGCGGLYIRPFWTASTGRAVARDNFSLLWVRGRVADGPRLWEALHSFVGVMGLVVDGKDVAVRVSGQVDEPALAAQLAFILRDDQAKFRRATPGLQWWRLGPLTEAELWRAEGIVAQTGLSPLRRELRFAKVGFRHFVYFSAVGSPTKLSLDDGTWQGCEAKLQRAEPPPRSTPPRASGGALPPTSVWGGSRKPSFGGDARAAPSSILQRPASPSRSQAPVVVSQGQRQRPSSLLVQPSGLAAAAGRRSPRRRHVPGGSGGGMVAGATELPADFARQLADLSHRLTSIADQNAELLAEIRSLRQENADLRRQLDAARSTAPLPASSGALVDGPPEGGDGEDAVMGGGTPERPRGTGGRRCLSMGPHTAHGF